MILLYFLKASLLTWFCLSSVYELVHYLEVRGGHHLWTVNVCLWSVLFWTSVFSGWNAIRGAAGNGIYGWLAFHKYLPVIHANIVFLPGSKSHEQLPALLISERTSWFHFKCSWDGAQRNHWLDPMDAFWHRLRPIEGPGQRFWGRLVYRQNWCKDRRDRREELS